MKEIGLNLEQEYELETNSSARYIGAGLPKEAFCEWLKNKVIKMDHCISDMQLNIDRIRFKMHNGKDSYNDIINILTDVSKIVKDGTLESKSIKNIALYDIERMLYQLNYICSNQVPSGLNIHVKSSLLYFYTWQDDENVEIVILGSNPKIYQLNIKDIRLGINLDLLPPDGSGQEVMDYIINRYKVSQELNKPLIPYHMIKTINPFFTDIWNGAKTFEIRKNDRNYKEGDFVHLLEWENEQYTSREIICKITYILKDYDIALKDNYIAFAFIKKQQTGNNISI